MQFFWLATQLSWRGVDEEWHSKTERYRDVVMRDSSGGSIETSRIRHGSRYKADLISRQFRHLIRTPPVHDAANFCQVHLVRT
jgi:hypothetical protein